ncbi:hypothetical protein LIER_35403 [Lithospermum erythrorhizon]|uniref:Uncharacterized protein n=1 Tax=Lithospermum erythrorhizon TaxID=34254 RepID=A0AAV3NQ74_LITER
MTATFWSAPRTSRLSSSKEVMDPSGNWLNHFNAGPQDWMEKLYSTPCCRDAGMTSRIETPTPRCVPLGPSFL